ncbi:RNA-binding protein 44 isoform X2 [Hyperolius riggenbachi]
MLLSAHNRNIIKEYGNLPEFLKSNPSLLIDNDWVKLKGESALKKLANSTGGHRFPMDISKSKEYTYCSGATGSSSEVQIHEDTSGCLMEHAEKIAENASDCNIYVQQRTSQASVDAECPFTSTETEALSAEGMLVDAFSSLSLLSSASTLYHEAVVNVSKVQSDATNAEENDTCPIPSIRCPDPMPFSSMQPEETSHNCVENMGEILESPDRSRFVKEGLFTEHKGNCLDSSEPEQVVPEEKTENVLPLQKYLIDRWDKPVDQESVASDKWDEETFLSIKSGSGSRSNSPLSFDEHTDTESCIFDDAFDDFPIYCMYQPISNSDGLVSRSTCGNQIYGALLPDLESRHWSHMGSGDSRDTAVQEANLQRNMACNTELSWLLNYQDDKETQTPKVALREMGVNTDVTSAGMFPVIQGTATIAAEQCKGLETHNGNRDSALSPSSEALRQRAVKAELQLINVQRWMCRQVCWKTHEQRTVNESPSAERSQSGIPFNMLSALAEVEEKYLEMKTQIQSGVPLDNLVPLSMQLTKVEIPSDNLLHPCFMENFQTSSGLKEADKLKEMESRSGENIFSSTFVPNTSKSPHEEVRGTVCKPLSAEPHKYYVHVGNLAPVVTEVDLRVAFGKFLLSEVFLEVSSLTSSYAVLIFTSSELAQAAVREMDGKHICGKKIKVRAISVSNRSYELSSEVIKMCSAPQDKAKIAGGEATESSYQLQPKKQHLLPEDAQPKATPRGPVDNSIGGSATSSPHKRSPFVYANQSFPSAPQCNTNLYSCMPPAYPWLHNLSYSTPQRFSNIPHPVFVPYSRPLQTFSPAPLPSLNSAMFMPINTKPLFSFCKDGVSQAPQYPTKDLSHNTTRSAIGSTKVPDKIASAVSNAVKEAISHPAKKLTSSLATIGEDKNAIQVGSAFTATPPLAACLPATAPATCKATAPTDILPIHDTEARASGVASFKPSAPLRVPKFLPDSVNLPDTCEMGSTTAEAKPANGSTVTQSFNVHPQQKDPIPDDLEWGVYPKLDPTTEYPTTIIPNQLNLSQFRRVVRYLSEHHNCTKDQIVDAMQKIRIRRGGTFGGLTIPQIIKLTSSLLASKDTPPA